jgi:hypothetical protein
MKYTYPNPSIFHQVLPTPTAERAAEANSDSPHEKSNAKTPRKSRNRKTRMKLIT